MWVFSQDLVLKNIRTILRAVPKVPGQTIIPKARAVARGSERDRMSDPRRCKRSFDQTNHVSERKPRPQMPVIRRGGFTRSNPNRHRLEAVAVPIQLSKILAKCFGKTIVGIGSYRRVCIDDLCLLVKAHHMNGARKYDPLNSMADSSVVKTMRPHDTYPIDVREIDILFDDAREMDNGINAGHQVVCDLGIAEIRNDALLVLIRTAQWRDIGASVRIPTKSPRRTDMKSPVDSETMSPTFPI
ncbi:hypothetical protein ACVWXM_009507 [Bradyrhizobium sp. GM7.3]